MGSFNWVKEKVGKGIMDRRLALFLIPLCLTSKAVAFVWFGGLTEAIDYKSALPCVSDKTSDCNADKGIMGMALDQASKAGLKITSIEEKTIKETIKVFIRTQSHGVCQVEPSSVPEYGDIFFLCSQQGFTKSKTLSIDHVFTLIKNNDDKFQLIDVSEQPDKWRKG